MLVLFIILLTLVLLREIVLQSIEEEELRKKAERERMVNLLIEQIKDHPLPFG